MSNKGIPKNILNVINKKMNKSVSESTIKKLASNVTKKTMEDESQLRKLIHQVASTTNLPVSDKTVNDIVNAVKKSGAKTQHLETLVKMFMKK